jgi:hypothetical protein
LEFIRIFYDLFKVLAFIFSLKSVLDFIYPFLMNSGLGLIFQECQGPRGKMSKTQCIVNMDGGLRYVKYKDSCEKQFGLGYGWILAVGLDTEHPD